MSNYPTLVVRRVLDGQVGVPVVTRVPASAPDRFVLIDASPPTLYEVAVARQCEIIVQAYAQNDQACVELLEQCERLLEDRLGDDPSVLGWQQSTSPYSLEDPNRATFRRWQFTGTFYQSLT